MTLVPNTNTFTLQNVCDVVYTDAIYTRTHTITVSTVSLYVTHASSTDYYAGDTVECAKLPAGTYITGIDSNTQFGINQYPDLDGNCNAIITTQYTPNSLQMCYTYAYPNIATNYFDATYSGSKNSLYNFRNYGPKVPALPTIVTDQTGNEWLVSGTCSAYITSDGNASITDKGICYSSSNATPTTSDDHTHNGTGTASFNANITGLTHNTTYYCRAYAINSVGTGYGSVLTFNTLNHNSLMVTEVQKNSPFYDYFYPSGSSALAGTGCYNIKISYYDYILQTRFYIPAGAYAFTVGNFIYKDDGTYAGDGWYPIHDPVYYNYDKYLQITSGQIATINTC